ncbi:MAG: ABC-2 family transporter protein, partial [Candidatus Latescibacterota bacterium]|nr:ABC-2 family transporter protein [Candidatus Latescibacterota bacterium]
IHTVTYGGVQTAQFPLPIYRTWFRQIFTYIIPLACITYYPALALLEKTDPLGSSVLFQSLSPVIGIAFFYVCIQIWHAGVRHYRSTGS